jgi:beta-galactosidase
VIHELRSYPGVLVDGKHTGTLDRRKKDDRLDIEVGAGSTLDVLVEGTGRINFTAELRSERLGINGAVTLGGQKLSGWQVFPLPLWTI